MNTAVVSVIIPAYNAALTIGKALEALSKQDYLKPIEVIVVDDGSTDATAQVVQGFANVKYLRQDNAGPAVARNYGARVAVGDILAFTDADCIPHQDWISLLINAFNQHKTAVVAGSYGIANPQSFLARTVHAEIIFRHTVLMGDFPKSFGSYNFSVSKKVFWRVGGFDESYRNASGEDNDLSYKILKAGHCIYFERNALVDHHHPTSVMKYLKEQFRHGYWRVKMYAAHPQMAGGDGYTYWKDIIEIPWAGVCFLFLLVSAFNSAVFNAAVLLLCIFLVFEIASAYFIFREFVGSIFAGIIIFFRAFARGLGLSTGIFIFLNERNKKKS